MQNPFSQLIALQLNVMNQWLRLTREAMDFYLSLQPKVLQPVKISRGTSLVPLGQSNQHRSR